MQVKKVVLAYSGGLDTSVALKWLQEEYNAEVITYTADLGQGRELDLVEQRAKDTGAVKVYIEDLREEFVKGYVFPALKAGAIYESRYMLATALGRPLIGKRMVEIAQKEGADAVAHGCTGKGNDQVRLDVTTMALDPKLKIIAPVRIWSMKSREEEIEYAQKHNIPVPVTKKSPYSIDLNLWGRSIECGILENPWLEPPDDIYELTVSPQKAPDEPTYVEIEFESGIPVKLDGKKLSPVDLIDTLSKIGGANGVGRVSYVEDRLVGIKSRETYECPAATILFPAIKALEELTLDRQTIHFKEEKISHEYSRLVYFGLWFSPLREALDAFIDVIEKNVTGTARVKLYKGNCNVVGAKSPYSLYDQAMATYDVGDMFDHTAAEGFIQLWGLPLKIKAARDMKKD
ncbi:MAG: argininosuccinate synthase [Candidatus Poribacteria bacterium]|nr:argininosuccinate synthase [Candidatus Poribacteria bacterium]